MAFRRVAHWTRLAIRTFRQTFVSCAKRSLGPKRAIGEIVAASSLEIPRETKEPDKSRSFARPPRDIWIAIVRGLFSCDLAAAAAACHVLAQATEAKNLESLRANCPPKWVRRLKSLPAFSLFQDTSTFPRGSLGSSPLHIAVEGLLRGSRRQFCPSAARQRRTASWEFLGALGRAGRLLAYETPEAELVFFKGLREALWAQNISGVLCQTPCLSRDVASDMASGVLDSNWVSRFSVDWQAAAWFLLKRLGSGPIFNRQANAHLFRRQLIERDYLVEKFGLPDTVVSGSCLVKKFGLFDISRHETLAAIIDSANNLPLSGSRRTCRSGRRSLQLREILSHFAQLEALMSISVSLYGPGESSAIRSAILALRRGWDLLFRALIARFEAEPSLGDRSRGRESNELKEPRRSVHPI